MFSRTCGVMGTWPSVCLFVCLVLSWVQVRSVTVPWCMGQVLVLLFGNANVLYDSVVCCRWGNSSVVSGLPRRSSDLHRQHEHPFSESQGEPG